MFKTSNKLKQIWLKGLNTRISKIEELNQSKVSRMNYFQFSPKGKGPKTYLTLKELFTLLSF